MNSAGRNTKFFKSLQTFFSFDSEKNIFFSSANPQCASIIENTLDFSYEQILQLMESENSSVRLAAGNALASFAYNNSRVQAKLAKLHKFPFEYFQKYMENPNEQIRCAASFQVRRQTRKERTTFE